MIYKKLIIGIFLLGLFNGCAQNAALLAPAYTLANTGNICQEGVSYGSNRVIKKIKEKSKTDDKKSLLKTKMNTQRKKIMMNFSH